MTKYHKNNITLQLRVPIQTAISILGRLYGSGIINRAQYYQKLRKIDKLALEKEQEKDRKMEFLLKKVFTKPKRVL